MRADSTEDSGGEDSTVEHIGSGDGLAELGYRRTESECHRNGCSGTLWYDDHTLVCGYCSQTVDLDQRRRMTIVEDPWERYRKERPRYRYSERVRLPGGFLSPYEWTSSDDHDGSIIDMDPSNFYK
jgi:hypothetical protein